MQWSWYVRHPGQRSCGYRQTSHRENGSTANPDRSFLLPCGAEIPVDYLQFYKLCGYRKFLQPQSSAWAEVGWKYDITVSLGVSERDAETEDTWFTQQQNYQHSHWGNTLLPQHHLLGSIQQQTGEPALWSHGYLAPLQWSTHLLR